MENNKIKTIVSWLLVLVWAIIIFGLSAMPGTGDHPYSLFYFVERKTFHVLEYFVLSILLWRAWAQNFSQKKSFWFAGITTLLYAASDEWHQTFVFGREGVLRDVVIDSIGIFLAVIFILKFKQWKEKRKQLN
ncbi:MAG: VanZ family protein [Candidatus Moranbacteria bacterium]|nr:VanZ family protein [Candidatus Moranbacteria bacterium]